MKPYRHLTTDELSRRGLEVTGETFLSLTFDLALDRTATGTTRVRALLHREVQDEADLELLNRIDNGLTPALIETVMRHLTSGEATRLKVDG